ncbi:RNA exonuclease 1 homolog [Caerostris darwini]|uniref:RNA exonuclease 1 homolog n=1 Tax=Caerostris darwini TaxID=1538125 RepID=A0AAV4VXC4_9ARAC|nr:RNA exonuclease 1 homolog [Caerostris darwini]
MLPSIGYFKDILCPYDKVNRCHRPYCHFKHIEPVDKIIRKPEVVEDADYLLNNSTGITAHYSHQSSHHHVSTSCYVPTPVGRATQHSGILKNSNTVSLSTVIPVYNPTPISKLKELNSYYSNFESKATFSPEYSYSSKKKKKIEEYDPTAVKVVSKKCVTFADQSCDAVDDVHITSFSSSEEDVEDVSSAPKFSDDDLDNDHDLDQSKTRNASSFADNIKCNEEEEDINEKNIDEFSLVDKILVDSKRSEKLLANFQKPISASAKSVSKKSIEKLKNKSKKVKDSKTVDVNNSEHTSTSTKERIPVEKNNIVNCDEDNTTSVTETESEVKCALNESKKNKHKDKLNDPAKKLKTSSSSKSKSSSNSSSSSSKGKSHKSSDKSNKSSSSDKSKSKSKETSSSKESSKNEDSKNKHDKLIEKSVSKTSKSEKSKSEKSSSKNSKSEKHKSVPSKTEKSSNSKVDKNEKSKTSSKVSKEVKLQDEKVTSSSIDKKNKLDASKQLSKSSDSHNKQKSKINDNDGSSKDKTFKRKTDDSNNEKNISKEKSSVVHISKKLKNDVDNSDDSSVEEITVSSDSDGDTTEECWRIFNETYPEYKQDPLTPDKESLPKEAKAAFKDITIMRKQRLAHAGAANLKSSSSMKKFKNLKTPMNPGQVMMERFAKIREAQKRAEELKNAEQKAKTSTLNPFHRPGEKKRISAVSNHSLLAAIAEKNRINNLSTTANDFSPLPSTVSKSLKVTKRVAHVPDAATKPRPVIPVEYGSKVPTVIRQKFLNTFIDEYIKFSSTEEEAYENALDEEKKAFQRSSSKAIYMNVASNALNRLRHRKNENGPNNKKDGVTSTTNSKTVSHEAMLNGPQAQRGTFSIERKKPQSVPDLKGIALYEHLSTYILIKEQLKENGFPLPHPTELGKAVIEGIYASKTQFCNDPFKRTCCRCQKTYYVNVDGDYVRDEECDFHWGRLWKKRVAGTLESRYTCCQGDSESEGCCVGAGHVFEGSEAHALKGFVNTLPKTPPPDEYYGIYSLDCEMCYTTAGVELTRISVIDPDLKTVYETFVKPHNKVLDYNTRFSGITEDNLKNVRTTIRDVQAVLLCMFNDKTILIGHSLESDLKALKIFHQTVVDTSVVFPHKMGLPFKRALRTLMVEKLNKIIQNDVGGHDSCEDAVSCMELMLWRVKEDLKGNR